MIWKMDTSHAKGMDTDIPFRLCLSLQQPSIRAYWFSVKCLQEEMKIRDIFTEQMDNNGIPYVIIGKQLWFIWAEHWCRYDAFVDEDEIKFYLLVFRNSRIS